MILSIENGSSVDEILSFLFGYFGVETEKTGEKFYTDYPTLKTGENYYISGFCAILRHLATKKDRRELLGSKACCLKTPSDFSPKSKLIEDLVNADLSTEKPFQDFELIMSSDICQHNLEKAQRTLVKRERSKLPPVEFRDSEGKLRKVVIRRHELPELEHAFLEGIELSISDLAAFVPISKFVKKSDLSEGFVSKYRATINWLQRMNQIITSEYNVDVADYAEKKDVVENGAKVICRRYTRKLASSLKLVENDVDRHTKATKSSIQKLEIRSKKKINEIIETCGVEAISTSFEEKELKNIEFIGEAKPIQGGLGVDRALRKEQQLQNLVLGVAKIYQAGDFVVDFCAGGGHLGLAVASHFPDSKVAIVDYKEESLQRAQDRVQRGKMKNVIIVQSNLNFWSAKFNIGLGLHACGTATDQILNQCEKWGANFVVSPCCYGRINELTLPRSKSFNSFWSHQTSLLISHAADITPWDEESAKVGKMCMNLTDTDRAKRYEEESGYKVKLYSMVPYSATPKNNFLVGVRS